MALQNINGFIIIVGTMQVLLFFVHYVFYRFGVDTFSILTKYKFFFGVILTILSISFTSSMVLVQRFENEITENLYYFAAIWLGTLFWIFIAIVMASVSGYFISNHKYQIWISLFLIIFAALISIYGVLHARSTVVVKKDIYIKDLPASWEGRTAVFVADFHYGHIYNKKKAIKDLNFISKLSPDMLFIAGDFFDAPHKSLSSFSDVYKDYNPKYGKYFVNGNHEEYAGEVESDKAIVQAGFNLIDNKNINLEGVQLLGIPYTTSAASQTDRDVSNNLFENNYKKDLPSILLKHIPIDTDIIRDAGVSFAFFGHTHNGQFWPLSLMVKRIYGNHAYGLYQEDDTIFYTTSGIGGWGPPQRIGTDSELLLVTFHKK